MNAAPDSRTPRRRARDWLWLLGLVVAAATAYVGLQRTQTWQKLEAQGLDQRFQIRGPRAAPDELLIVAIDDRSIVELGGWPLRRDLLKSVIDRLGTAGVAAIGIDLLLLERPGSEGKAQDRRVAESLSRFGNAVLAAALPSADVNLDGETHVLHSGGELLRPDPVLIDAAAGLGHVNVLLDGDGRLRRLLPAIEHDGVLLPTLPQAMYRLLRPDAPPPVAAGRRPPWLDFYGPEGSIATISVTDLLQDRVEADRLRGRAVLIGATATGLGDAFATPYSPRLAGVEYFATALGNLLDGQLFQRDETVIALDAAIVALSTLLAALAAQMLAPMLAASLTLAAVASYLVAGQYAFVIHGLWLSAIGPPLAMAVTLTGSFAVRLLAERRQRRLSDGRVHNLRRYVAPALADALADNATPAFTDRVQTATVLFIDIAGFTGISEAIGPAGSATLLRGFHETVETAVNQHGGVLTSFLGDGAMAVFGLPAPRPDDAVQALATARLLARTFTAWAPLRIGIGLHAGPVAITQLGGREQVQLTATGDTVNLASRLENLTRRHRALLALSDAVFQAVRESGREELLADLQALGDAEIRGRRALAQVWLLPATGSSRSAA